MFWHQAAAGQQKCFAVDWQGWLRNWIFALFGSISKPIIRQKKWKTLERYGSWQCSLHFTESRDVKSIFWPVAIHMKMLICYSVYCVHISNGILNYGPQPTSNSAYNVFFRIVRTDHMNPWGTSRFFPDTKIWMLWISSTFWNFCFSFPTWTEHNPFWERLHSILDHGFSGTNWLSFHFDHARLEGIGGPGAPHSIRLERIGDSGLVPSQSVHLTNNMLCYLVFKHGGLCRNSTRSGWFLLLGSSGVCSQFFGCDLKDCWSLFLFNISQKSCPKIPWTFPHQCLQDEAMDEWWQVAAQNFPFLASLGGPACSRRRPSRRVHVIQGRHVCECDWWILLLISIYTWCGNIYVDYV